MQDRGCYVLHAVLCDGAVDAEARRQRAAEAGAIEAALEAMRLYPQEEGVQEWAVSLLFLLSPLLDNNEAAVLRTRRMLARNAQALLEAARVSFPQNRTLPRDTASLLGVLRRAATAP